MNRGDLRSPRDVSAWSCAVALLSPDTPCGHSRNFSPASGHWNSSRVAARPIMRRCVGRLFGLDTKDTPTYKVPRRVWVVAVLALLKWSV